jgi:hypothetical protein
VERLKRGVETNDLEAITWAQREFDARLALLSSGKASADGLLDLLLLAANPEAQVRVEFSSPTLAMVYFYSGSLPFAEAMVRDVGSAEQARKQVDPAGNAYLQPLTIAGQPAVLRTEGALSQNSKLDRYQPARQVLAYNVTYGSAILIDLNLLKYENADAVVYGPECAPAVRTAVEGWATERKVPVKTLAEALKGTFVIIAGKVPTQDEGMPKIDAVNKLKPTSGFNNLYVASGTRVISLMSPSPAVAVRAAELILAGQPISPKDAAALRSELVKTCAPNVQPAALPKGMQAYCGDLHMHTFYSDRSEDWNKAQYFQALTGTALDAWEHIPDYYEEWKAQGMLPVVTGTSDTHSNTPWSERTLILAPSAQGEDIAEAIRAGQAIAVSLSEQRPEIFFGSEEMRARAWALLADGEMLKQAHTERLRAMLKGADLVGLLKASPPRTVAPDAK